VSPALTMLTAGFLAAQTVNPSLAAPTAKCNCQNNPSTIYSQPTQPVNGQFGGLFRPSSSNGIMVASADDRPSLLSKLQGLFGKKKEVDSDAVAPVTVEPPTAKPGPFRIMQRLPAGQPNTNEPATVAPGAAPAPGKVVQPVTYQAVPPNQAAPAPIPATSSGSAIATTVVPPSRPNRLSEDLVNKVGHETDYSWITGQLRIENGLYVIHYATPEVVDQHSGHLTLTADRDMRGFQDGDFVSIRGNVVSGNGRAMYRVSHIDRLPR
jgi:hypothetical protein